MVETGIASGEQGVIAICLVGLSWPRDGGLDLWPAKVLLVSRWFGADRDWSEEEVRDGLIRSCTCPRSTFLSGRF